MRQSYLRQVSIFNWSFQALYYTSMSPIRGIYDWFVTRMKFIKPPLNCGKQCLLISINNAYLAIFFDAQSQITAGFYKTTGLFYFIHFLAIINTVYMNEHESNQLSKESVYGFQLFLYAQYSNEQLSSLYLC